MKKYLIILLALVLASCKDENGIEELINGKWNIMRIEQNGNDLIDLQKPTDNKGMYFPPLFLINLENDDFLIEVDSYREKFLWGNIFIEELDNKVIINITKSDKPELIGTYEVEIDTLKENQNSDTFKIYMLSDKNTLITAIKTRVNPILKK